MLKRILIPLDGTEISERALDCGREMARRCGASLVLARIVEHLGELAPGLPPELLPELQRKAEIRALNYLEDRAARLVPLDVQIYNPIGSARDEIARLAEAHHCDLILMASHGRDGAQHLLLGSVAEGLLRQSPCPVLLVRPEARPASLFSHVLVPVDGSSASLSVLEKLPPLLAPDGKVTLLQSSGVSLYPNYQHKAGLVEEYLQRAEARLRLISQPGMNLEVVVLEGQPVSDILSWSSENDCDLVAMTTHGRTGFRRFWLGSVCEKVARLAPCHVLVHRPHHRSEQEESAETSEIEDVSVAESPTPS
ncbi:universal stress protein [bacterium]|nr:universal stress protein [bacterium]